MLERTNPAPGLYPDDRKSVPGHVKNLISDNLDRGGCSGTSLIRSMSILNS
jgi:hypothetical protein